MNTRGFIIPAYAIWLAAAALATQLVPNWRVTHLFPKGPDTKALAQAQADAEQAKHDAEVARQELLSAKAQKAKDVFDLTQGAQQMVSAIPTVLAAEPQTVGVKLATSLANRATDRLTAAIGNLPQGLQDEIRRIVADAKSEDAKKIADADAALKAKDVEVQSLAKDNAALGAKIPGLESTVKAKDEALSAKTALVAEKTASVATFAEKAYQKEKEAGSLSALCGNLWTTVELMAALAAIGYGLFLWARWKFGGIPQALGKGLAELRAKHPELGTIATDIFDKNLNRHEQAQIAQHAQT